MLSKIAPPMRMLASGRAARLPLVKFVRCNSSTVDPMDCSKPAYQRFPQVFGSLTTPEDYKKAYDAAPPHINARAPAGYDTSDNGSIAKYGWYPFVGALSTIILSKEIFIIDEEWVLAGNLTLFMTLLYTYVGRSLGDSLEEERYALFCRNKALHDYQVKSLKMTIHQWKTYLSWPEFLQNRKRVVEENAVVVAEAAQWKLKQELQAATVKQLQSIADAEQKAAADKLKKASASAEDFVRNQFKENATLRAEATEFNINLLTKAKTATPTGPIGRIWTKFISDSEKIKA
jgi:hypothetical protein